MKAEKEEQKAQKAAEKAAKDAVKMENWDVLGSINSKKTTEDKKQEWYRIYSTGSEYNPNFSMELYSGFESAFKEVMVQYQKSQTNAIASDKSSILPMGKWILDQIDVLLTEDKKESSSINNLRKNLQKIADKQCSR